MNWRKLIWSLVRMMEPPHTPDIRPEEWLRLCGWDDRLIATTRGRMVCLQIEINRMAYAVWEALTSAKKRCYACGSMRVDAAHQIVVDGGTRLVCSLGCYGAMVRRRQNEPSHKSIMHQWTANRTTTAPQKAKNLGNKGTSGGLAG